MPQQTRPIRVLVVDDDPPLCEMVRLTLELEGIQVAEAHHVIQAERHLADAVPDALVLDIGLPGVDGAFYCARLRESPRTKNLPIIAISGSDQAGIEALAAGATTFIRKPLEPLHLLATVQRLAGVSPFEHAAAAGDSDLVRLIQIAQRQHDLLVDAYRQTLESLADAVELRDFGTGAHSRRVAAYATKLTLEVQPSLVDDETLEWGFLLHDVGKIGIPDQILFKPGALTTDERQRVQQHTLIGERLVGHIPLLDGAGVSVIRSHHERWDGNGYPDGLSGTEIPMAARIFAAADALDAMTDHRPYRDPLTWDDALAEIERCAGTHFDPDVVAAVAVCEPELRRTYETTVSQPS